MITWAWRNRHTPSGRLGLLLLTLPGVLLGGLLVPHVEMVPYSNRLHFVFLSREEETSLGAESEGSILQHEASRLLPPSHDLVQEVEAIVSRLRDVCIGEGMVPSKQQFRVHVIDSPIANAMVLPNGSIFVYKGILPYAETEAGLAAILGHEISHALARHSAEKIGYLNLLMILTEFIRGLSDHNRHFLVNFSEYLAITILQPLFTLAHSRHCETEADAIGVKLAAKAGYDPRHAAHVWRRMLAEERNESVGVSQPAVKGSEAEDEVPAGDANAPRNPDKHFDDPSWFSSLASLVYPSNDSQQRQPPASPPAPSPMMALTVNNRVTELLSTHPCHARRVQALEAQSVELMDTYHRASEGLFLEHNVWDNSERKLSHRSVNPRMADVLATSPEDFSRHEEELRRSLRLAEESASLMVGAKGEEWRQFLQSLDVRMMQGGAGRS
jgi:Zn-dependent protease with chaperone function